MKASPKDLYKWYVFHKDVGYEMRDYRHLKKEIEDFLEIGCLKDLIGTNSRVTRH